VTLLTQSTAFCDCSVTKVSFSHRESTHSFSRLFATFQVRLFAVSNIASSLYFFRYPRHGNTGRNFPSGHDSPRKPPRNHSQSHAGHDDHFTPVQLLTLLSPEQRIATCRAIQFPIKHNGSSILVTIAVIGQDSNSQKITIEAVDDDLVWLGSVSKLLRMGKMVTLGQPTFSQSG
jgi:hypothetical protein